ncbi:hypothetical protein KI387_041163 [Taxus chinensis]|uniref:Uncharacterized protein n=1 Tax=Taxus chinensis TaxID=29808 RepID=A0AA38F8Y3_TAXCH|nr:hypothetical protein KI387_041163 [Taxus chinensis]
MASFVSAKGLNLHRNRVPPILGLGVKHKGFEEGTTQPRTAGRGQPRPSFGQPRRPLRQGNSRCLDQFCMMLKFAFPSLLLSEECNQELGNEGLSTPSEKGSISMAAMSQTTIIDTAVIIYISPHLISVAFVFGNMECSSTLIDKDGTKNEDATLGHGLACQAADYLLISCFMTEITAVWKAFYTAEYAKEVVIVVLEVEDEGDFNEERGNGCQSLFGQKLFHLTGTGSRLWECYNMFLHLGMMALGHESLQLLEGKQFQEGRTVMSPFSN